MSHEYLRYTCSECGFEAEYTHCDECDGIIVWKSGRPTCTGCGMVISWITCRECGHRWNI